MDVTGLTDRQEQILETLQKAESWLDRARLAEALGKRRLNPHEVEMLERLVEVDLVERREKVTGITSKFVYRVSKQDEE